MTEHFYQKVNKAKKNEAIAQEIIANEQNIQDDNGQAMKDLIYYDESVSMLERTAYRVYPIVQEVASRMVKQKEFNELHQV